MNHRLLLKGVAVAALVVGTPIIGGVIASRRQASVQPKTVASTRLEPAALEKPPPPSDFVGVLLPQQMANLSPLAEGKVLEVRVKLGQHVKQGAVLVVFDARGRQQALAMAEAQLKVARAEAFAASSDFSAARKRAERRNATVDVGGKAVALVSGEEAAQSKAEAQGAGARAASASAHIAEQTARVEQLRLALEETEMRAPFEGVVTALNFEPGTTTHPGDVVARVVGGEGLRVRIAVPEEAAAALANRRARLTFDDRTLFAVIDQVAPEVEPASRSFLVEGNVSLADNCGGSCSSLAGRVIRATLNPELAAQ